MILTVAQGLGVAVVLMVLVWLLSLWRRDASIVDAFWGLGFVLLAWFYLLASEPAPGARPLVVALLVTLWGGRLSLHIARRNRGQGEDYRYRAMRERHGARFWWVSLFTVFLLQAGILWIVAWPLVAVQYPRGDPRQGWLDVLAAALFAVGFLFEAVGDRQLARFKADPANRGQVLDTGLWRYTRHPNYFGDAVVWWGLFGFAAAAGGWWSIVGPLLMTLLLMRVSGVTLLEQRLRETKPAYRDYVQRTSAFFPWPPRRG